MGDLAFEFDSGDYGGSDAGPSALAVLNDGKPIADSENSPRAGSRSAQDAPEPVKEKIPAPSDSDSATQLTVQKMGEYIKAGAQDDGVKAWEAYGRKTWALGRTEPQLLLFADYFLLRHCLRFKKDEPRLFEIGEPGALDLLIAPAVLVKMDHPAEDCDGFTMLLCSLLLIQGIKCYIVTVAADREDRTRWSHVFAIAELLNGARVSLDASQPRYPGWMIPRRDIFRWQAWDLDGKPVDVPIPEKMQNPLHGYRRRGVGYIDPETGLEVGSGLPTDVPVSVTPSSPSFDWTKFFQTIVPAGVKAYQTSQLPSQYFVDPSSGKLIFAPANVPGGSGYGYPFTGGSSFGSLMPILGIGLGLVALGLVVSSFSRGR